jgi:hypothetical protein
MKLYLRSPNTSSWRGAQLSIGTAIAITKSMNLLTKGTSKVPCSPGIDFFNTDRNAHP